MVTYLQWIELTNRSFPLFQRLIQVQRVPTIVLAGLGAIVSSGVGVGMQIQTAVKRQATPGELFGDQERLGRTYQRVRKNPRMIRAAPRRLICFNCCSSEMPDACRSLPNRCALLLSHVSSVQARLGHGNPHES